MRSLPNVAPWRWTTSKTCVLTAFSRRYTRIPRMKMMMWATPTLSRMISMHARWASNVRLLAMTGTTSSYQSYGHLKKSWTCRRSNWDLRGDPGTRRYKVSGLLIIVQPKKTSDHALLCFKSKYRLKNLKWSLHTNVTFCFPSVINWFFCMGSFYLLFFYHCLLLSFPFTFLPPSTLAVAIRCRALQMIQTVMSVLGSLLSPRLLAPLPLTHTRPRLTPPLLWGKGPYSCTTVRVKECFRASGVYWVLMLGLELDLNF